MSELLRDLRFGVRLLLRSPVFAVTTVVLLAAGISANTLIFSVVNALLLRPLAVAHPANLVRLIEIHPTGFVTWSQPYSLCDALAAHDTNLSEVICQGEADVSLTDGASTERVRVHLVSPNFFTSLGIHAQLGRVLSVEDERAKAMHAVLSYGFWQRHFRGETSVLGRGIILGGHAFTIVGVTPERFNGLAVDTSPDVRVPASTDRAIVKPTGEMSPAARPLFGEIFGRLRPGVPLDRANAEVDQVLQTDYRNLLDLIYPRTRGAAPPNTAIQSHLRLESIANGVSALRAQFSRGLEVLMGGVALLLLMACANVAGLLLARSAVRTQEFEIRLALGASPVRIIRQLFIEGLLLSVLGGLAGILLTIAGLPWLLRAIPPVRDRAAVLQPLAVDVSIDPRVLGFALGITFLTAILFALWPALRAVRGANANALRAARSTSRRQFGGKVVVAAQIAICTLILIGSAMLVQTLERMRSMNPGFDQEHVITFTIDPGLRGYTSEQSRALSKALLEKTAAQPGVAAVAIAGRPLMRGTGEKATAGVAGTRIAAKDFLNSSLNEVTPGYFETMGMHILGGRDFDWFDRNQTNPKKVIVNQTFVRRFFPNRNPIGGRFGFPGVGGIADADDQIVGVVSDAKYRSLREPVPPTVYSPQVDGFNSAFVLTVRTRQRPESMLEPVRQVLRALDPTLPFIEVHTLREEVDASLWQERLLAWLSTLFGVLAALLSSIGLYGALDYAVKSRTREIGLRMALGAQRAEIIGLLSRETLLLIASGIALGLCGYAVAAAWIERVLFGVQAWEPIAIAAVITLVALVGVLAAAPATLRAIRVDPATALRAE